MPSASALEGATHVETAANGVSLRGVAMFVASLLTADDLIGCSTPARRRGGRTAIGDASLDV